MKLTIQPVEFLCQGPYKFFVNTEHDGCFYFINKSEAKKFIKFYTDYKKDAPTLRRGLSLGP